MDGRKHLSAVSHDQPILVKPGETTFVTLGGSGRTVMGRVSANGIRKAIDWQQDVHNLTLQAGIPPEAVVPQRENFTSDQDFMNAMNGYAESSRAFWLSEAGREAQRRQRTYVLHFAPDGSFHVNDVPPGTYELSVTPMEPPAPVRTAAGGSYFPATGTIPIGSAKLEFVVPDNGETPVEAAVNLGVLPLKASTP